MNRAEREHRDAEILRLYQLGYPATEIASTVSLSERQVRRILTRRIARGPSLLDADPLEIVDDHLDVLKQSIHDLAEIGMNAPTIAGKVKAIRAKSSTISDLTKYLQAIGIVPTELGKGPSITSAVRLSDQLIGILNAHGVDHAVQVKVYDVIRAWAAAERRAAA